MLTLFSHRSPKDQFGCLSAHNSVIEIANGKLKAAVDEYRRKWPDTIFLHYDSYGAALEVIQTGPAKYGKSMGSISTLIVIKPVDQKLPYGRSFKWFWLVQGSTQMGFERAVAAGGPTTSTLLCSAAQEK